MCAWWETAKLVMPAHDESVWVCCHCACLPLLLSTRTDVIDLKALPFPLLRTCGLCATQGPTSLRC